MMPFFSLSELLFSSHLLFFLLHRFHALWEGAVFSLYEPMMLLFLVQYFSLTIKQLQPAYQP
jgi:hypothetical protein